MNPPALETRGLTKRFGKSPVVDELSLAVPVGSVCGLLGNNGAGKTTTIRMLMGHLYPSAGSVLTLGVDPHYQREETLQRIAYVSESMRLPWWMTVAGALRMNASLFPKWEARRADQLLDAFDLSRKSRFGLMSSGQRRKTLLLLALCQGAELLIFDEPANGLDLESRRAFLDCVLDLALEGNRTVLLSSHILSDLERVVDRIILLRKGRLLHSGVLDELKSGTRRLFVPLRLERSVFDEHFRVHAYEAADAGGTTATVLDFSDAAWLRFLSALPGEIRPDTREYGLNLEELYLEFAGNRTNRPRDRGTMNEQIRITNP